MGFNNKYWPVNLGLSMKINNSFFHNKLYNNINPVPNKCPIRRRSFHLPHGILFTFHSQYTNLTNNPLGISFANALPKIRREITSLLKTFNLYNSVLNFTF